LCAILLSFLLAITTGSSKDSSSGSKNSASGESSMSRAITAVFDDFKRRVQGSFDELNALVESHKLVLTGNLGRNPRQMASYFWLTSHSISGMDSTATIDVCETGFNSGHSAAFFLELDPNIRYHGWDLGEYTAAKPAAALLQKKYGDKRVNVVWGDAKKTVPAHLQATQTKCDIVSVDGEHTYEGALSDLQHFARALKNSTTALVLVDDCCDPGILKAFKQVTFKDRLIQWHSKVQFAPEDMPRDLVPVSRSICHCIGRYLSPDDTSRVHDPDAKHATVAPTPTPQPKKWWQWLS